MIAIFNKFRIGLLAIYVLLAIFTASVTLVSCSKDDELEIKNDFPFEVNVMPVPKDVTNGQTVEIRITIQRTGNYSNTQYFLRYFQFDGQGTLQYYNEPPYLPNDLYPLASEQFRLYYTSTSAVSQSFDVWISDSFGNEKQLSFQFNSSD
ncbi:MAG TPA: DUF3872 domain-containing protein [Flavobacterium sp.]|jgi:hypothetical protein|uniref:DUF3872 domain-containing protein n=1 Tax=Sphingobacterium hotanense TaxID=649196 RepID=A0ABT7NLR0_9SPHI|nr:MULTISPECIES: DUF3872 domain-containing protein [Bacteroidota]MCT1531758.1 DUF3872 domain-containing protein [Sphingobacterium daejeonense]MDM1048189.1 DUF3872 domain-containing protein [Sphingobacterium hotanense]